MITIKTGNIFNSNCDTIVNTVNCVGVMGAGIAFEFKLRYPEMYQRYRTLCATKQLNVGQLWLYKAAQPELGFKHVLCFPTKKDWKDPSELEYLKDGLEKFVATYKEKGITSIAFPVLGAGKGGIEPNVSIELMTRYLSTCDIEIEIWQYDDQAKDKLYEQTKQRLLSLTDEQVKQHTGIRIDLISKIRILLQSPNIHNFITLSQHKGVGKATLEKLFQYSIQPEKASQETLF
jgi:O-acetyl-ADP-ribose deacetylase (regulator of RNase III)